jgi:hypothetical protein
MLSFSLGMIKRAGHLYSLTPRRQILDILMPLVALLPCTQIEQSIRRLPVGATQSLQEEMELLQT